MDVRPRQRSTVGLRVRTRPNAMPTGTAGDAIAERHAAPRHDAATDGAAENRDRRRREALATAAGSGAKNRAAGKRYGSPQKASMATHAIPNRIDPMMTENAAAAYRRTTGR